MSKQLRIIIILIVLVIVAGVVYLIVTKKSTTADQSTSSQTSSDKVTPRETTTPETAGTYVDYTPEAVAKATGQRVLFFHASWCPQCRQLDASIKAGPIPVDTTIYKVDYDSNQALRQKYGVTIQTTLVLLDGSGNVAKKYVAYDDPSLEAVVRNVLE